MANVRSDKQMEIYEFIRKQIHTKGYPPSVREICEAVNLKSTSTVHGHLERLERKGYIRRDPTKPRTIEIIEDAMMKKEFVHIPVIGKVSAGQPILAVENIEDMFSVPVEYMQSSHELFSLTVSGESMIEAGIFNGDLAILEKCSIADNGDIVVALIENEVTLKRFFKEDDYIRLQPENSTMDPIIVDDCVIIGRLVGLFRNYKKTR